MSSKIFNQFISVYSLAKWTNGLAFKDIHFSNSGVPIIKIAELKNGISTQTQFTNQVFDDSVKLNYDDLLFSWSGNPDTSIDVFRYRLKSGWLNQHIFKVEPIEIDKDYLFYLLKSLRPTFAFIASNKQTTGLGHVTISDLKRLMVHVHSLSDQQHIVDILGTLDEKIENNNKIIVELESIISSKYHELVARNTTEIPLSNCIELYTGKLDANAAEENGEYPFFTCGITPEKINTYAFDCEAIIIAGNGNFNVKYYNGKFNAYQRTYVIKVNKYFAIILQHYKGKIKEWSSSARGSVIKFLTKSMLIDDTIKISNNYAKNEEYESFSKTIQEKIKNLLETNAKLNQLKQLYLKKFFG